MNEVSLLYDMYCRINIELHITVHVDSSYIMLLYLRNSMTTHYKPTRFESSPILCFVRTCVWKYGEMPSAICVKISAKEYILHTCTCIYIYGTRIQYHQSETVEDRIILRFLFISSLRTTMIHVRLFVRKNN